MIVSALEEIQTNVISILVMRYSGEIFPPTITTYILVNESRNTILKFLHMVLFLPLCFSLRELLH